jgi:uncharacterized protein YndB with AHSA1/START domain
MKWLIVAGVVLAVVVVAVIIVGTLLPKRHVVSRRALIHQPPEAVFALISGPPTWRPSVKSFAELPARDGRPCWREEDGHGQKITYERVESDPPRKMVTRIADPDLPFGGSWKYEIDKADGGSTIAITEDGEVYNPVFRFVSRFIMGHSATIEGYLKDLGKKFGEEVKIEA